MTHAAPDQEHTCARERPPPTTSTHAPCAATPSVTPHDEAAKPPRDETATATAPHTPHRVSCRAAATRCTRSRSATSDAAPRHDEKPTDSSRCSRCGTACSSTPRETPAAASDPGWWLRICSALALRMGTERSVPWSQASHAANARHGTVGRINRRLFTLGVGEVTRLWRSG